MSAFAARVVLVRLHQRIGAAGLAGLLLAALAVVGAGLSWRDQRRFESESREPVRAAGTTMVAMTPAGKTAAPLPLRPLGDVALLLARMERAAVQQDLGWPRADYRINAATAEAPASLEVHCGLKGPYPNIRRFVTTLLQDTPALTLRDFSLARTGAEAGDVEAKLGIVVYLAADAPAALPGGSAH